MNTRSIGMNDRIASASLSVEDWVTSLRDITAGFAFDVPLTLAIQANIQPRKIGE